MATLLKELIEMEAPDIDDDGREKKYYDEDHARKEAQEFISRARSVLNYNKKEGNNEEVAKLAHQFAKDYYNAICDEINTKKYNGGGSEQSDDTGGSMYGGESY